MSTLFLIATYVAPALALAFICFYWVDDMLPAQDRLSMRSEGFVIASLFWPIGAPIVAVVLLTQIAKEKREERRKKQKEHEAEIRKLREELEAKAQKVTR